MTRYDIAIEPDAPVMNFKVGDRLTIEGEVTFGMDMSFCRGTFPGVVFTIKSFLEGTNKICLKAPGYGEDNNYGNGCVYINAGLLAKKAIRFP